MCKGNEPCRHSCFWIYVIVAIVAIVVAAILVSVFALKPLISKSILNLSIIALSIVILSCTSLICVTVIAIKAMVLREEIEKSDKNGKMLDSLIARAINSPVNNTNEHIHKISGEITIRRRR